MSIGQVIRKQCRAEDSGSAPTSEQAEAWRVVIDDFFTKPDTDPASAKGSGMAKVFQKERLETTDG